MAYIIKRAILVTQETFDQFLEDVHNIPFQGKDKRQSPAFYLDIQRFIQHLVCNNFLYAKDSGKNKRWTLYSPLSSVLGKDKLKFVFEQSKYLCCSRALELLQQAGIIDIKPHNHLKRMSRRFALSKRFLNRWFGCKPKVYMKRQRYFYLTTGLRQRNRSTVTEESLIQQALERVNKPIHATRHASRETHDYMRRVYAAMGGLRVNLDKLNDYIPANSREVLQKGLFLHHLKARGCRIVSSVPMVVEYFPEYKLAERGTRSFEKEGGFQAMKSAIKWEIFEGYNYDIKSSQLTILRHELVRYQIACPRLEKITKESVMHRFNIDEKAAKTLIYSLIYSLGDVRKHKDSKAFEILCEHYGYEKAVEKADQWKLFIRPIKRSLKRLVQQYVREGVNCPGRGVAIRNAVRQSYMINPKKVSALNMRRILSHMLQGIESKAVYETILANPGVCGSIEHDGLVSSTPINWFHPYLELKLKYKTQA